MIKTMVGLQQRICDKSRKDRLQLYNAEIRILKTTSKKDTRLQMSAATLFYFTLIIYRSAQ
jgi:hypothetical protein